ncbi:MAG: magnesium/cobalt transporter CorA [Bdellovibrionota bacterium]|jgi:magnesium transporter
MTVNVMVYDQEGNLQCHESLDVLDTLNEKHTIWIDIDEESTGDLQRVATHFGLHELTIEDCLDPDHSPKLDDYGKYLFMIFRSFSTEPFFQEDAAEGKNREEPHKATEEEYTQALAIYLSEKFVITHRLREIPWLDALIRRSKQIPERTVANGTDTLTHAIVDVLIDRFSRGLNYFENSIDELEDLIIEDPDSFDVTEIIQIKRRLAFLRQVMRDQRVVISRLAHEATLIRERHLRRYFRDIEDHAMAISKTIDTQIDSLVGIRDVYFAMVNVQLGDIMRILAVITTVAVPLNLVTGMYGMNFGVIPLLDNRNGFWIITSIMLLIAIIMLFFFRKKKWI